MADPPPRSPNQGRAARRQRGRWLLALALLVCNLVAAEIIARPYVRPPRTDRLYCEHPRRFWTLQPGGWRREHQINQPVYINSLGLRGDEPVRGDLNVLLLGDSCIYGANVASTDTIDRRLEQQLQQITGQKVKVFNAGCPGYSTQQGLDLLKDIGPTLRPDIVVIAYLYGDRYVDIIRDNERLGGPLAGRVRTWLWKSSLYRVLRDRFRSSEDDLTDCLYKGQGNVARVTCADYASNLQAIADLCRGLGARHLVFVRMPMRGQPQAASGTAADAPAPLLGTNPVGGAFPDPGAGAENYEAVLGAVARQEQGLLVNGPGLWQGRPQRTTWFWDDIHFNAAGCDAFATDLAKIFVAQGYVQARR